MGLRRFATGSLRLICALLGLGALAPPAHALEELREFYRGTRAVAMGGAFVALADDEQAIFFNPAGLAGVKGFTFNFVSLDIESSLDNYLAFLQVGSKLSGSIGTDTLNELMGKRLYARAQISPSLVLKNFGIAPIVDGQFAFNESNPRPPRCGSRGDNCARNWSKHHER
jgi:hypothetical protein